MLGLYSPEVLENHNSGSLRRVDHQPHVSSLMVSHVPLYNFLHVHSGSMHQLFLERKYLLVWHFSFQNWLHASVKCDVTRMIMSWIIVQQLLNVKRIVAHNTIDGGLNSTRIGEASP